MNTVRKCSVCGIVNIQSDRITCSNCVSSPLDEYEVVSEGVPDPAYEEYVEEEELDGNLEDL